jgi:hypothetical protein
MEMVDAMEIELLPPYADFSELRINDHPFGFHPRICLSKDMNDVMYIWSEWEYKWIIE